MNPFAESCAFVADDSKHVFINYDQLKEVARDIALQDLKIPSWREPVFPESDDKILEFFGVVNSVNFCFTDFKTGKKFDVEYPENSGQIWRGSFGMTAAMKRALDGGINILDPEILAKLNISDVSHIFRHASVPIPMLAERTANLKNVGWVLKNWAGSFENIFETAGYKLISDGKGIVERIDNLFNCYRDTSFYQGRCIEFVKRAQLFPMVYHGRALSSDGKLQPIRDPENFGAIADYELPKVLRALGVLQYNPGLAIAVDAGIVFTRNSPWEIEIRAQTINVIMKLLKTVNKIRSGQGLNTITMAELDYAIWFAGWAPEYRNIRHHYTYTTAY